MTYWRKFWRMFTTKEPISERFQRNKNTLSVMRCESVHAFWIATAQHQEPNVQSWTSKAGKSKAVTRPSWCQSLSCVSEFASSTSRMFFRTSPACFLPHGLFPVRGSATGLVDVFCAGDWLGVVFVGLCRWGV